MGTVAKVRAIKPAGKWAATVYEIELGMRVPMRARMI
jgi:hypothetical protein